MIIYSMRSAMSPTGAVYMVKSRGPRTVIVLLVVVVLVEVVVLFVLVVVVFILYLL